MTPWETADLTLETGEPLLGVRYPACLTKNLAESSLTNLFHVVLKLLLAVGGSHELDNDTRKVVFVNIGERLERKPGPLRGRKAREDLLERVWNVKLLGEAKRNKAVSK